MTALTYIGPPPKHSWIGEKRIAPDDSVSGCEETHRACTKCSVVMITVHRPRGFPYRLWQTPDGKRTSGPRPECKPVMAEGLSG